MNSNIEICAELKPCPFCGGAAKIWECPSSIPNHRAAYAECNECHCKTAEVDFIPETAFAKAIKLIRMWENRSSAAPI